MHTPSPLIRRVLYGSAEKLCCAGHEIIRLPFEDLNVTQTIDENWETYGLDGSEMANKFLSSSGEPLVPSVIKAALLSRPAKTLEEIMNLNFEKIWTQHNVDIIVRPPSAYMAVSIDE